MHAKFKKFIIILLSLIVVIGFTTTASAVEPRYSDTTYSLVRLYFIGTTANCSVSILGAEGVTSITNVNITVSDSKGNPVGSWNNLSSTGQDFTFFNTVTDLNKGANYKKVNTQIKSF